ncbi:MAG: diaminopimelate decarboxylase [Oscillospiraceae bacterium]|nr:diaminopimelate decarboxylase [Oscillospiraceae bacterium]
MIYENLSVSAEGHLIFSGCDTLELAKEFGTALFVMDEARIRQRCREYKQAMAEFLPAGSHPLYASKAMSIKRIYKIMAEENMGVDVVSPGELYTAVKAGFPMENAYFHGSSKTDDDIRFAMEHRVGYFVCDNADELDAIDAEAARQGICQKILLRLSPGIDPHTHEKINTGRVDSKFGVAIETGQAAKLVEKALSKKNIDLWGYHCHVGSQLFDEELFCDSATNMLTFAADIQKRYGYIAKVVNLGGGMGVPYTKEQSKVDYAGNIQKIGAHITALCQQLQITPPTILMEPGRSIVADSGITLYTVTGTKEIPGFKNYVGINGGMTDNPRYTLYQAPYTVYNAGRMNEPADFICTVAGRCCESGDLIQEEVALARPARGDILAVLTTGAYNYSMASNYNRIPRPAVVMIGENGPYLAVRRETYEDLLLCDA